jgi:hypothetical protein
MVVWTANIKEILDTNISGFEEFDKKVLALEIKIEETKKTIEKRLEKNLESNREVQENLLKMQSKIDSLFNQTSTEEIKNRLISLENRVEKEIKLNKEILSGKKKEKKCVHLCEREDRCLKCYQKTEDDPLILELHNAIYHLEIECDVCPFCGYEKE